MTSAPSCGFVVDPHSQRTAWAEGEGSRVWAGAHIRADVQASVSFLPQVRQVKGRKAGDHEHVYLIEAEARLSPGHEVEAHNYMGKDGKVELEGHPGLGNRKLPCCCRDKMLPGLGTRYSDIRFEMTLSRGVAMAVRMQDLRQAAALEAVQVLGMVGVWTTNIECYRTARI